MSLTRKRDDVLNKRPTQRYGLVATLCSTNPKHQHIAVPAKDSGVVIGRSSGCDIRVGGGDVSGKHCRLVMKDALLVVIDTSSNGVYVNDERVGPQGVLLRSGDTLALAKTGGKYIVRYSGDKRQTFFDDYILGSQLGAGHYAVVKEARDRTTGDVVAVKVFHPNRAGGGNDTKLQQEMSLLLSISHRNIVKFIAHYEEPVGPHTNTTYLVLEKVNSGELFQRIVAKLRLRQDETRALFRQLLEGLLYLHGTGIIHRDIKPENILLDIVPRAAGQKQTGPWDENEADIVVKIADFGLAKFIGERQFTSTLCGTPAYVAPEILHNSNYTTKADIWLAGVLLYVCLCGFPPFSDELAPPSMKEQILSGKYAFYSPYWDDISDVALDLIAGMLVVDLDQRFDVKATGDHLWFDEDVEVTESTVELPVRVQTESQPVTLRERFTSELNYANDG